MYRILIYIFTILTIVNISFAKSIYEGKVTEILDNGYVSVEMEKGETIQATNERDFKVGDKIIVTESEGLYFGNDYNRKTQLLWLFGIFGLFALIVGKSGGLNSLIGMGFSFFVIFKYILPRILLGESPIIVAISGAAIIIPITFYLSHGFNKKAHVAIGSTIIALVITGLLTQLFIELTHLTGFSTDEAMFLQLIPGQIINMKGLLLAGIIIGAMGILDDVTVSQSSIVYELKQTNPELSFIDIYLKAMNIGKDHIASMINTLVLVYAGASLPLLLMFINSDVSLSQAINAEMIAEEIVRTLVGSIGIILAVPLTTFIAAIAYEN